MNRLLELVAEGNVHSHTDLARKVGVSEELLGEMIEDLVRMGYLRPVSGDCQGRCAGCPLPKICAIGGPARVWALTERARQQHTTGCGA